MTESNSPVQATPSDFLKNLGLISLCISIFSGLILGLMTFIFTLLSWAQGTSGEDPLQAFFKGLGTEQPEGLTIDRLLLLSRLGLAFVVVSFVISIGIYLKKKWARIPFVFLCGCFIVISWAWLYFLVFSLGNANAAFFENEPLAKDPGFFKDFFTFIQNVSIVSNLWNVVVILGSDSLLVIVMRKLLNPNILSEFENKT